MKQTKAIKLAYAAGFLDGEGCIDISRRNRNGNRSVCHQMRVKIAQKDGNIIDWFSGNFGGTVIMKNKTPTLKNPESKNWIYEWRVTAIQATKFLKAVLPFLRYKREQAELGIRFQQRMNNRGGKGKSLTKHEIETRDKLKEKMQQLKHKFTKSKNPSVIEYNFKSMVQPQRPSEITP